MKIKLDLSRLDTQAEISALRCAAVAILSALPRDEAELALDLWEAQERFLNEKARQDFEDELRRPSEVAVAEEAAPEHELPPFGVGSMVRTPDGRLGMVTYPLPVQSWVRFGFPPDEPVPNDRLSPVDASEFVNVDACSTSQEAGPGGDAAAGWHGDPSRAEAGEISPARAAL